MRKDGILNPALIGQIAALGHTDLLVIADAGLPIPSGMPVIDLSLACGIPSFHDTLHHISSELAVESYIATTETDAANEAASASIAACLNGKPSRKVTHEDFKKICLQAKVIVRTGECTPYANVILVCGTSF